MPPTNLAKSDASTGARAIVNPRVFISYAHKDYEVALKIRDYLTALGVQVLWDRAFLAGTGFPEQIKAQIAYSHVFMPIITTASSERGWVHQEIGFAMALNVPVMPVALEKPPQAMISQLHAILLRVRDDVEHLSQHLPVDAIWSLIERAEVPRNALYACAEEAEDRAVMFEQYAREVRHLIGTGDAEVRQSSAMSSFHIPCHHIRHRDWGNRYNSNDPRSRHHYRVQRSERLGLEWHARRSGARLVICPEDIEKPSHGVALEPQPLRTRYQTLIDFLTAPPTGEGKTFEVKWAESKPLGENVTIVGDWFMATSVMGTRETGYRQTIFTRHTPTILERIEQFDSEFESTRCFPGTCGSTRENAIAYLEDKIKATEIRVVG